MVRCVRDAIDRGELAPDTDCSAVVRAVSAPLYYRMLTTDLPLDVAAAHQAADAAWVAARSGAAGVGVVFRVDGECTGRRVGGAPVN